MGGIQRNVGNGPVNSNTCRSCINPDSSCCWIESDAGASGMSGSSAPRIVNYIAQCSLNLKRLTNGIDYGVSMLGVCDAVRMTGQQRIL